ncbi:unnamed protein product [Sphagnum troendelagicum]|uniref:Uncharacterized protein n=1 Tax=Sphagnum troendelagicum TaxID=128251 RepID=A0ABP0TUD6_9BRYO
MPECPADKGCMVWVERYLKDCVCNRRDTVSLVMGLLSVVSWGVAEVPQIITNFQEKSTEGISLLFLMTWVVGDLFNLAGCYLEPATLPTQFYMAMLYTITTVVLVSQTIYYDHVMWRFQVRSELVVVKVVKADVEEAQKPGTIHEAAAETIETSKIPSRQTTSITVPQAHPSPGRELYYTSARSLASSYVPTVGSYGVGSRGGSAGGHMSSSYLLPHVGSITSDPLVVGSHPVQARSGPVGTSVSNLISTVEFPLLFASSGSQLGTCYLPTVSNVMRSLQNGTIDELVISGSFLLVVPFGLLGEEISPLGEVFGWIMAVIYMGGRLPQIWLNIKRGTAEGLNPLMFMFALVGNITYVGSILVRSTEWSQLKPNLPWLVDAGVCVLLDTFILCQFIYFYRKAMKLVDEDNDNGGSYHPIS